MPRRIREFSLHSTQGGGDPDGYFDRVVKYVPADVIAAWTAAVAIIKGAVGIPSAPVLIICFVVGIGLTYWWTAKQTEAATQPPATKQIIIACIAFVVWVLALGDLDEPLKQAVWAGWNAAYAKLLLILFTAVSGKV
jgi:hypothetical protein